MAGNKRGKVSELFDYQALEEQHRKVMALLTSFMKTVEQTKPITVKLEGAEKITELVKAMRSTEQATAAVAATTNVAGKEVAKLLDQAKNTRASFEQTTAVLEKYNGTLENNARIQQNYKTRLAEIKAAMDKLADFKGLGNSEVTAELAKLEAEYTTVRQAMGELQRTMNAQAKLVLAESGSYDELNQTLGLLRNNYRQLSAEQRNTAEAQEQLRSIQELDAKLKEIDASIGNFQRNVGNYAGTLAPLFDTLKEKIAATRQEASSFQDLSQKRTSIGFQVGGDRLNKAGDATPPDPTAQLAGFERIQTRVQELATQGVKNVQVIGQEIVKVGQEAGLSAAQIKQITDSLQGFKPAEYSGKFSGAFKVLATSLDEVRQKLKDPALAGAQLEQLQKEEQLLAQVTANLTRAFGSTREELRAFQEAAVTLGVNLGEDSTSFQAFTDQVGETKDQIEDLKGIIAQKSSDTRFLDGAVEGISALAGAYGAAQGAAALFDANDQELQKTMVKLQAILTIVNGLQAVQNALQGESATMQTILAAKTGLLNAAKALQAKLSGANAAAQEAEAAAATENAAANEAAAGAQVASAEGAATNTAAMEATAVATEGATAATNTFKTALAASGIGLIILAIAAAVVYLVKKTFDWASSNEKALENQEKLVESTGNLEQAIRDLNSTMDAADQSTRRYLQNQIDLGAAAGESAEKQFMRKKALLLEEKRLADQNVTSLEVTNRKQAELLTAIESLQGKKVLVMQQLQQALKNGDETGVTAAQRVIDSYDKSLQQLQGTYQAGQDARQAQFDANKNLSQHELDVAKFNADEHRKLVLSQTQIEVELTRDKNERILSDDESTLSQRLAALQDNAAAQRRLIEAQKNDVLDNPSSTATDRVLAVARAAAEEQKVNRSTLKATNDLREEFRLRDLVAYNNITKQRLQTEINLNKEIATNQVFSFEQRKEALGKFLTDERRVLDESYRLKLQQTGVSDAEIAALDKDRNYRVKSKKITDAELAALQREHENGILQLTIEGNQAATNVLRTEFQKREKAQSDYLDRTQQDYALTTLAQSSQYAQDIIDLNNSLAKKELSVNQYNEKRAALDGKYQKQSTAALIDNLQQQLAAFKGAEDGKADAMEHMAKLRDQLANATTDDQRVAIAAQMAATEEELKHFTGAINKKIELERQLADLKLKLSEEVKQKRIEMERELTDKQVALAQQAVDGAFEAYQLGASAQQSRIDDEISGLDKKAAKDKEIVTATITNAEAREKALKEIDIRTAAQKEQLEKKKGNIEVNKARFEKIAAVFDIGISTVKEVAKIQAQAAVLLANPATAALAPMALAQIPFVIGSSAIAAALIAAKPLPKYFAGTEFHPGGLAIVGDGGVKEYAVTPQGDIIETPATATVMDLPAGTKVFRDEIAFLDRVHSAGLREHERVLAAPAQQVEVQTGALERIMKRGLADIAKAVKPEKQPPARPGGLYDYIHS